MMSRRSGCGIPWVTSMGLILKLRPSRGARGISLPTPVSLSRMPTVFLYCVVSAVCARMGAAVFWEEEIRDLPQRRMISLLWADTSKDELSSS